MSAGALAARLTLDANGFKTEMMGASAVSDRELKKIQRQVQFVNDYIKEMAKSQREVGVASGDVAKASHAMEEFSFKSAGAKRELLVLTHELSQGNYSRFGSSLLVLGERTGAASLLFSALGVALVGAAAAVGGFAFALIKGHAEQDAFNKSMQLTNDFAGLTASSFEQLAETTAHATNKMIGSGRDAIQALVSTGRVGQESIGIAAEALLNMERLTGQSADEIAKDFAKMGDNVAKWAQKHNEQYHFLSAAQFKYIQQLEDQGKGEQAQAETYRLLNERMKATTENLGYLSTAWKNVKDWADQAWEAMKGVGKEETTAQKIASLQKTLDIKTQQGPLNDLTKDAHAKGVEKLRQEIYLLQEKAKLETKSATAQAAQAQKDEKAIAKMMEKPPKAAKYDPIGAIRTGPEQYKNDFLRTEIASYQELANAEAKAAEAAKKLSDEQSKSFNDWFQKFNEKDIAANMPQGEAIQNSIGKYLRDIGDQSKAAEQLVTGAFSRMEDALVNFVHTGHLSFKDLFTFMADEYLRNQIRMQEKKLLDSAGNFDWGSALTKVGSWFSGWGEHADGLAYVPSNGYPAILHEGERVMTKQDNVRASSGGAAIHIDNSGQTINVGQGVSRGEVAAAVQQGNAQSEQRIRRLLRNGNIGS